MNVLGFMFHIGWDLLTKGQILANGIHLYDGLVIGGKFCIAVQNIEKDVKALEYFEFYLGIVGV